MRAFRRAGYEVDHRTGSHIILRNPSGRRLSIPDHRELAKGTLRALIREAGLSKEHSSRCYSSDLRTENVGLRADDRTADWGQRTEDGGRKSEVTSCLSLVTCNL